MSPIKIIFGIAFRMLATAFLFSYAVVAIATEVSSNMTAGALISSALLIIVLTALAGLIRRHYRPERRRQFALASFTANASMALCLAVHLSMSTQITSIHIIGGLLGCWYIFMSWNRYQQIGNESYLRRFEPKPQLPSAWAVLKQAKRSPSRPGENLR